MICLAAAATIGVVGCRDTEPPAAFYQDVGSEGRVLLPTSPVFHEDVGGKDATAEWHPYRPASPDQLASADDSRRRRSRRGDPEGGLIRTVLRRLTNLGSAGQDGSQPGDQESEEPEAPEEESSDEE